MFLQGPSLFAYNNALFEAKDWTGIRMLGDSVKEKDPLKVGRFGLGFKSVYHMTGRSLQCIETWAWSLMFGPMHFIYQINRLTTTKVDSTYLGWLPNNAQRICPVAGLERMTTGSVVRALPYCATLVDTMFNMKDMQSDYINVK